MTSNLSTAPAQRRVAAFVALAFALSSVIAIAAPASTLAWGENAFSSGSEKDLVALTNRSRAAAGLKALKVSSTLTSIVVRG